MSKFLKKIGRVIFTFFESIFKVIDKFIVMPISRLIYNVQKGTNSNNNSFNKLLNRPQFLIIMALVFAIICFVLIDNKVLSLVSNEAEIIKDVPVNLIYNEEAFVVENVPKTVDITISGRRSDIYLAKQLGEFEVELNLSKYTEAGTYRVYFTSTEPIKAVDYILNPNYINVTIKDKVSEVKSVTYDLVGTDKLDNKLSVSSVTLDSSEVVVKGSQTAIDNISSIKALVDLSLDTYKEKGTYELTNIPLVAYDKNGEILSNVEIVPKTLTGTLVLNSYKMTVPLSILTTGNLVNGKAIASILINNSASFTVDIYGEEEDIKDITSVPVTVNVDGYGAESVKNYTVIIAKPVGVRDISVKNVTITISFGDEEQKTLTVNDFSYKNLAEGYTANPTSNKAIEIQAKGVRSNLSNIDASNIRPYLDLSGLGEGTYEVEVKIDNNNPLINYMVTSTVTVKITKN